MTHKKAKKKIDILIELANRNYRDQIPDYIEALEMASEALKRQLPCEWCKDRGLYQSSIDISIGQVKEEGKWKLKASYSDMGGTSDEEVNAKFCFNCGRKL